MSVRDIRTEISSCRSVLKRVNTSLARLNSARSMRLQNALASSFQQIGRKNVPNDFICYITVLHNPFFQAFAFLITRIYMVPHRKGFDNWVTVILLGGTSTAANRPRGDFLAQRGQRDCACRQGRRQETCLYEPCEVFAHNLIRYRHLVL
jgi:hypothetical protein